MLCAAPVIPVSQSTPLPRDRTALCACEARSKSSKCKQAVPLWRAPRDPEHSVNSNIRNYCGLRVLHDTGEKGNYFRILFRSTCFLSGKKPGCHLAYSYLVSQEQTHFFASRQVISWWKWGRWVCAALGSVQDMFLLTLHRRRCCKTHFWQPDIFTMQILETSLLCLMP